MPRGKEIGYTDGQINDFLPFFLEVSNSLGYHVNSAALGFLHTICQYRHNFHFPFLLGFLFPCNPLLFGALGDNILLHPIVGSQSSLE